MAFGSVGTIEGNISIQCGKKVSLSKQQLVDCDVSNAGCDCGNETGAFDYIIKKVGPTRRIIPIIQVRQKALKRVKK